MRLSNVNKVFSVAQDCSSSVFPQKVLLDTGAQPVMLGRSLAESLGLNAKDLDPCPFTIATSLGGTEHPMGLTKAPLRLQFNIGTDAYTHISLRCVVTNATTYDILLGQQALYPIGFGHDSWIEEAWFRPGWSQGDGWKEALPVDFGSLASTTGSQTAMFGCVGQSFATGNFLLEGNRSAMDSPPPSDVEVPSMLGQLEGHPKDPIPPWKSSKELSQCCGELVAKVEQKLWEPKCTQSSLQRLVELHDEAGGIALVELFAGLGAGLAAALEAGLVIQTYTYVDNNIIVRRSAMHHLQQLQMRYPRQLSASAIQGCMSRIPTDIALIGYEDLKRLGRVDLVVAGWPCQGHSRAGLGQGLQDPRSGLFWELLRLLRWWQCNQATPIAYIFENVPPMGIVNAQVHNDAHVVCQYLGKPVVVDAAALGSYAHRLRWKWTNLAHMPGISAALKLIQRSDGRQVDHILNVGRYAQPVLQNDQYPLTLVNHVRQPRLALPTLVSFPQSFAFRDGGPGMVFDANTRTLEEPCADERERAMGFLTGTTCGPDVTESQRRHVLGQAMDLTSMVWFMGICLAAQRYNKGGLEGHLGADASDQGAESVVPTAMQKIVHTDAKVWLDSIQAWEQVLAKIRTRDAVDWLVADDLRGERVLAALAQDICMEDAKEKFMHVCYARENPYLITKPQPIDDLVGVANRYGLIGVTECVDASIGLETGNGAPSHN